MTRPGLEIIHDQVCQWNDTGRERMQAHWQRSGSARGRKRRQVVPACSDPDSNPPAFAEGDPS